MSRRKITIKLPGGGLDDSEDRLVALRRECIEEIGCDIEVIQELGDVVEYRKIFKLRQFSYCYLAKVVGEKREPSFTDMEKSRGFEVIWMSPDKAKQVLSDNQATSTEGKMYIVPRDLAILEAISD